VTAGARLKRVGNLAFIAPAVLLVGLTIAYPLGSVIYHSFTIWNPGYASKWVGLENYRRMFDGPQFKQIMINEGIFLLGVPIWVITPLLLAVLLHERVAARAVWRTIFFFPATVSPAIIGILFGFLLLPTGPLDTSLREIGLGSLARDWLADPSVVRPTIIAILTWATAGTGTVIFSSALSVVPKTIFEAAEIDGAGWWRRFWTIAVPSLRRVIELWTVILVITVFVAIFPWIYTLTRGGPGYDTATLDFDIYQRALVTGDFGGAAAEAVWLLIVVMLIGLVAALAARARKSIVG